MPIKRLKGDTVNTKKQRPPVKLTMMKGLPGSGKTTKARQMVAEHRKTGRVSRDDLRAMLFDGAYTKKREEIVIDCERAIFQVLTRHKYDTVVDDTNITENHHDDWRDCAVEANTAFEVCELDTPIRTCIKRDAARHKPVGESVIRMMDARRS